MGLREVAVDRAQLELPVVVEAAALAHLGVGVEAVDAGVGGDDLAAALHQLGEVEGLGAHAAAGVEDMFSGTWPESQGGLLRAEALHREVAAVIERVLGQLAAGAHAQGLGLAGDGARW
jgi:hypothetical protein